MILIADSGSSKTDWLLLHNNEQKQRIETDGINPFFQTSTQILALLTASFDSNTCAQVQAVYFYGAGCIKNETDVVVAQALEQCFANAKIEVEDDMLGAARALLGNKAGIACILGTGANSCLYNGSTITDKVPTLGYILGDEGSGAYLGKQFLNNYFKRAIPADLKQKIDSELKLEWPKVLKAVYKGEYPSRFLASFSTFFYQNKEHPYIQTLIEAGFDAFLSKNVEKYSNYQNYEVNFVGSIAYYYKALLQKVAQSKGICVAKVLQRPIEGLKEYHLQNAS